MAAALGSLDIADVWTSVGILFNDPLISGVVILGIALAVGGKILSKVKRVAR